MADADTLRETIVTNASGPRRAQTEAGSAEAHSLSEQLQVLKEVAGTAAGAKAHRGLRFTKLLSPGPTG